MAYEKVEAKTWKPINPNDFIEGKLKSIQDEVGGNNSMLYHIDKGNEVEGVWGSAVLDPLMRDARLGDQVKIVFTGLGTAKPGKNAPKLYEVFIDKSLRTQAAPVQQVMGGVPVQVEQVGNAPVAQTFQG